MKDKIRRRPRESPTPACWDSAPRFHRQIGPRAWTLPGCQGWGAARGRGPGKGPQWPLLLPRGTWACGAGRNPTHGCCWPPLGRTEPPSLPHAPAAAHCPRPGGHACPPLKAKATATPLLTPASLDLPHSPHNSSHVNNQRCLDPPAFQPSLSYLCSLGNKIPRGSCPYPVSSTPLLLCSSVITF